jgi:2-polyprenyl-3-methyl-5-hydroxy-6-metoxy-1,4-benzoquinol methylase
MFHRGAKATGIDTSSTAISIAKKRTRKEIHYEANNLRQYLNDQKPLEFSLITCRLTYAFIEDKKEFLKEVRSVLNRRGVFIILTPDKDNVSSIKADTAVNVETTFIQLQVEFNVEFVEFEGLTVFVCNHKL